MKLLFFHWRISVIAFFHHVFLLQLFPIFHLCGNTFPVGFERCFCRQLGQPRSSLWGPGLCFRNGAISGLTGGLALRQSKDVGSSPVKECGSQKESCDVLGGESLRKINLNEWKVCFKGRHGRNQWAPQRGIKIDFLWTLVYVSLKTKSIKLRPA